MSADIAVLQRTQYIIVDPTSGSVSVVNAGPTGPAGPSGGPPGPSAFQIAVDHGFVGTETAWLASLVGPRGAGDPGLNGPSAYQVAVDNGFVGTQEEWLNSLVGPQGDEGSSAYEVAVLNGYLGTEEEWLASLKGPPGDPGDPGGPSAYDVAVSNGFVGTEAEWLASLEGTDGTDGTNGSSAYEEAVANGFVGTEVEWLASLVGPVGLVDRGAWSQSTAYVRGDMVTYTGSTFRNILAVGPVNTKPHTDPTHWMYIAAGLTPAGAWSSASTYFKGDVVTQGGSSYVLLLGTATGSSFIPGVSGAWSLLVSKGDPGTAGTNGTNGTNGSAGLSAYQVAVAAGFAGTQAEWLASLVGPAGAAGGGPVTTATGLLIPGASAKVGSYFTMPGHQASANSGTLTLNKALAVPLHFARRMTLDFFGISVAVISSVGSSVARIGLYDADDYGFINALLADFGTVSTTTTGVKSPTVNQVVEKDKVYWGIVVPQVGITGLNISVMTNVSYALPQSTASNSAAAQGYSADAISGALPATWPGTDANLVSVQGPRLFFRASA